MKGDIFSYGLVLYYMITGNKPWAEQESRAVDGDRKEMVKPETPKNLSKGPLSDLYHSCLCCEPDERPSAAEIINEKFQGNM